MKEGAGAHALELTARGVAADISHNEMQTDAVARSHDPGSDF